MCRLDSKTEHSCRKIVLCATSAARKGCKGKVSPPPSDPGSIYNQNYKSCVVSLLTFNEYKHIANEGQYSIKRAYSRPQKTHPRPKRAHPRPDTVIQSLIGPLESKLDEKRPVFTSWEEAAQPGAIFQTRFESNKITPRSI